MLADVVRENLVKMVIVLLLGETRAPVEFGDYPGDEVPVQRHLGVEVAGNLRELEELLVLTAQNLLPVGLERLCADTVVSKWRTFELCA